MHARGFPSVSEGRIAYEEMKLGLANIVEMIPNRSDPDREVKIDRVTAALSRFLDTFP